MYLIYADGGNKSDITYGSFKIYDGSGNVVAHKQLVFGYGTSNLAEYLSMIRAMEYAINMGIQDVIIFTDSKIVKKQIYGEWACNYDHLRKARNKVRKLMQEFDNLSIKKVTRNTIKHQLGH